MRLTIIFNDSLSKGSFQFNKIFNYEIYLIPSLKHKINTSCELLVILGDFHSVVYVASQGDQGFPGEPGPQGERGVGEPGPKVRQ